MFVIMLIMCGYMRYYVYYVNFMWGSKVSKQYAVRRAFSSYALTILTFWPIHTLLFPDFGAASKKFFERHSENEKLHGITISLTRISATNFIVDNPWLTAAQKEDLHGQLGHNMDTVK